MTTGSRGAEGAAIAVQSDEPPERVRRLADMAEASCFALQSLIQNVEVSSSFTLNGEPLREAAIH